MFRQFAAALALGRANAQTPQALFDAHPSELVLALETAWDLRLNNQRLPLGEPLHRSQLSPTWAANRGPVRVTNLWPGTGLDIQGMMGRLWNQGILWDHLIYAYMVENTRIFEIFRRVVDRFANGEQIGTPTPASQTWLRNTEELFFKDGAPFYIGSINSHVRPDFRSNRRNWYHRMFGMDLNHGTEDGKAYSYLKAEAANLDFINTFEELLREVWIGMTFGNPAIVAGPNPTDRGKIATLASKIKDMLMSRRQGGNLAREEFAAVSAMAWFHLTLEFMSPGPNSAPAPIVQSLRAEASGVEQRLFKIAERVGLPAHGLSKHYFEIADPLARILIEIEMGFYDQAAAAQALYTPGSPVEQQMRAIITHWTAITGRDVKARKVAAS